MNSEQRPPVRVSSLKPLMFVGTERNVKSP